MATGHRKATTESRLQADSPSLGPLTYTDDGATVVGYYSLTVINEDQASLPRSLRKRTPQSTGQPGALLARLAVRLDHQRRGLACDLTVDAVRVVAETAGRVPFRFVAVDSIDERARGLYEEWGFEPVPGDENGRLFLSLDAALASRRAFDHDDP
jgi:GNAT superfamily N-acetyltransferase